MRIFSENDALPTGFQWYRKKTIVPMVKMNERFVCHSREGTLEGKPGDFVAQDGHGGFYPISAEFHAANYEPVTQPTEGGEL